MTGSFTALVGCEKPVQLAGMGGGLSDVALAAAVSEAGGFGMLGAGDVPRASLGGLLDEMHAHTTKPFGVNFLMPFLDPDAVLLVAGRCRLVEFFYGDPDAGLVEQVHAGGALASWQVGSLIEARAAIAARCDVVIAQGTEAGGHVRGTRPLNELLSHIVNETDIPVVAAGGIGTAEQAKGAIDAGASAVRVGTRFLAATESAAHPHYVDALIAATATDTVLTSTFNVGWPDAPHRVLSSCIEAAERSSEDVVATMRLADREFPIPRLTPIPPSRAVTGDIAAMALYAGTSVDGVRSRRSAAEIVAELCDLL
jgi:nitronate monooxygenase